MYLTQYERETIINYNEAEGTASVYTCSHPLKSKLSKLSSTSSDIKLERQDKYSVTYSVPKAWIRITKPQKYNLTDEQRAEYRERMKKLREKQSQK